MPDGNFYLKYTTVCAEVHIQSLRKFAPCVSAFSLRFLYRCILYPRDTLPQPVRRRCFYASGATLIAFNRLLNCLSLPIPAMNGIALMTGIP